MSNQQPEHVFYIPGQEAEAVDPAAQAEADSAVMEQSQPVPITPSEATASSAQEQPATSQPEHKEASQLCGELLHLGNWLEYDRSQELQRQQTTTVWGGLLQTIGLRQPMTRRDLIRAETEATKDLFVNNQPQQQKYQFFLLGTINGDTHEWVFHHWHRQGKGWRQTTTRFFVEPQQAYQTQEGQPYKLLSDRELHHLWQSANRYYSKVHQRLYNTV